MKLLLAALLLAPGADAAGSKNWDVRLRRYKGDVHLRLAGDTKWLKPKKGTPLQLRDEVRVGKKGFAEISFSADSLVHLRPGTSLVIEDISIEKSTLYLRFGTLLQKIKSLKNLRKRHHSSGMSFRVRTDQSVAAVRGTEFAVQVSSTGRTTVGVFDEGRVAFAPNGGSGAVLEPNQEAAVSGGSMSAVGPLTDLLVYRVHMRRLRKRILAIQRRYRTLPIRKRRELREKLRQ